MRPEENNKHYHSFLTCDDYNCIYGCPLIRETLENGGILLVDPKESFESLLTGIKNLQTVNVESE